jgi:hypothetical protein
MNLILVKRRRKKLLFIDINEKWNQQAKKQSEKIFIDRIGKEEKGKICAKLIQQLSS